MKWDSEVRRIYVKVLALYVEGTEFTKQLILSIREAKANRWDFSYMMKTIKELRDFIRESEDLYELLEDLAYTPEGEKALLNVYYYYVLNDVKIGRKFACKIAAKKTTAFLRDIIPGPARISRG